MTDFRKQFPILNRFTYLNSASSGLLSEDVFEYRQEHDLDLLISGSLLREHQEKILRNVREAVGRFFNCAPNRVALTPNFSYGFNTLLEGLPKSKKILLLKNDYPSINWAVESRDFEVVYAEIDHHLEENIVASIEKDQPDIFAFSLVQYINGTKIDTGFLKKLKEEFPKLILIADGTQYCGTEQFDFESSGLDVLGASSYKWMNAGYGNSFFLFKESMVGEIAAKSLGFNSLQGKYKQQEGNFIGRFEPGHQDTLNFGSLLVAIQLIEKVGIGKIEENIKNISSKAKEAFEEENLLDDQIMERKSHSSIFNIKGDDALFHHLRQNNIICSQRGNGIRISFHAFNTLDELSLLMETLKKWRK